MAVLSRRSEARRPRMSTARTSRRGLKATGIAMAVLGVMAAAFALLRRGKR